MPYELKHVEIEICGEKLAVFQASNEMQANRALMVSEAEEKHKDFSDDARGRYVHYVSVLLYPSLAACTKGNIPTEEEYLYHMPAEASDIWLKAAREVNPSWFTFLAEAEESAEKKDVSQTDSTPVSRKSPTKVK